MATCPACNFDGLFEEPWREDVASDEICPCCAIHFGYDDFGRRSADFYVGWRGRWVADGKPWFSVGRKAPPNWSADEQLPRIVSLADIDRASRSAEVACLRCGKAVIRNRGRAAAFEGMHWSCFHYEFEHPSDDPDIACSDPSCPARAFDPEAPPIWSPRS